MILPIYGIAGCPYKKSKPVRDDHYRAFIRRFPCVGCGTERRLRDAMHIGPHGLGQKACDLQTAPGCRLCHRELHRIGPRKFQERRKIEFPALIEMFQRFYSERHPERVQANEAQQAKQEAA